MTIQIDIAMECPEWEQGMPEVESLIRAAVRATLGQVEEEEELEISVLLTNDDALRRLNRDWRGQDKPTNVLSFAALEEEGAPLVEGMPVMLGDVALAWETCVAEATEQGKALTDHVTHLMVHGTLHLLGYDHEADEAEAQEMEQLETAILAGLGVKNPYAESFEDNIAEGGRCGP